MFSEAEISIDGEISLSVCLWNVNNLTLTFSKAVSPAERTREPHTEAPNHPQLGQQVSTRLQRPTTCCNQSMAVCYLPSIG